MLLRSGSYRHHIFGVWPVANPNLPTNSAEEPEIGSCNTLLDALPPVLEGTQQIAAAARVLIVG